MNRNGVLVVEKPRGPTSHDVVAAVRRAFGTRAVGHAGTLDPMASGVLVLLVGEATKLSSYLALDEKTYRATVQFGTSTTTLDAEGEVVERSPAPPVVTEDALLAALDVERARTLQIPPAFSAISVDGQRAHRLARKGNAVELPPRPVTLKEAVLVARTPESATFDLAVSKGYYVRSFARDVGAALGVPSHLAALERRSSGPYSLSDATPFPPPPEAALLSLRDAACRAMPSAVLTEEGLLRCRQGKRLGPEHFEAPPVAAVAAWLTPSGELAAIGEPAEDAGFRVKRGFQQPL